MNAGDMKIHKDCRIFNRARRLLFGRAQGDANASSNLNYDVLLRLLSRKDDL